MSPGGWERAFPGNWLFCNCHLELLLAPFPGNPWGQDIGVYGYLTHWFPRVLQQGWSSGLGIPACCLGSPCWCYRETDRQAVQYRWQLCWGRICHWLLKLTWTICNLCGCKVHPRVRCKAKNNILNFNLFLPQIFSQQEGKESVCPVFSHAWVFSSQGGAISLSQSIGLLVELAECMDHITGKWNHLPELPLLFHFPFHLPILYVIW